LVGQGNITEDSFMQIRKGLHLAVNERGGTATRASVDGYQIAGKTGTAQVKPTPNLSTLSWFTGYAPFDKPAYSITVMLEGPNSGGKFAAPIASEIITSLLNKQ